MQLATRKHESPWKSDVGETNCALCPWVSQYKTFWQIKNSLSKRLCCFFIDEKNYNKWDCIYHLMQKGLWNLSLFKRKMVSIDLKVRVGGRNLRLYFFFLCFDYRLIEDLELYICNN
jgi:hypothetical protein